MSDKWMPIDSAPKDGEDKLLYVEKTGEQFVGYLADGDWIYAYHKHIGCFVCEPTHWMPLPPPPKDQGHD